MTNEEPNSQSKPSLTSSTAHGFVWLLGNTIGSKVINIGGNVLLAWLLLEEDFGLIGLAFTFTVFATLLHGASTRDVLVHRHTSYRLWSNAGFWMSIAMGLGSALLVMASGPVAATVYNEPRLTGLICVLALTTPVSSLTVVSEARLHAELRFRTIAIISLATVFGLIVGKVVLARLGFGAYSFAWPEPIIRLIRAGVVLWIAPPLVRRSPQFRRWKYLIGDSMRMLGANALMTVTIIGDCMVLGLFYGGTATGAKMVGLYYFALRNSAQTIHLFTRNMSSVLFPSLSKLQGDLVRQTGAFLRASRVLAVVGVPFCLLQAGIADPVVRFLFDPKWYPSIPVLQVLSLGMALRLITEPSYSMLKAQGRFKTLWRLALVAAIIYYAFVIVGARTGGMLGVSVAVAAWLVLLGPIQLFVAIRVGGGTVRDVVRVYGGPLIVATIAVGAGVGLSKLLPATLPLRLGMVVEASVVVVTTAVIYIPLIRLTSPDDIAEIKGQVQRITRRRRVAS